MRAQVEQLGLAGQPGCLQGGVGRSQGAGAEVVEMALLRRDLDLCSSLLEPSNGTVSWVNDSKDSLPRSQLSVLGGGSRTQSGGMCKGDGGGIVMGWDGISCGYGVYIDVDNYFCKGCFTIDQNLNLKCDE